MSTAAAPSIMAAMQSAVKFRQYEKMISHLPPFFVLAYPLSLHNRSPRLLSYKSSLQAYSLTPSRGLTMLDLGVVTVAELVIQRLTYPATSV